MVNVFGECTDNEEKLLDSVNLIKKITVSDGKYKDYMKEINTSYELAFQPYRTRNLPDQTLSWKSTVRCFKDKVYVLDDDEPTISHDITSTNIKDDGNATLTYGVLGEIGDGRATGIIGAEGIPGPQGVRGKQGPIGEGSLTSLCMWLPNTMLESLRQKDENGCYLIRDKDKDLRFDKEMKIVEWISRCDKKINLVAKAPAKKLIKLPNDQGFALDFNKSCYTSNEICFMLYRYGFICITFHTSVKDEHTLITSFDVDNPDTFFNEISVTCSSVSILAINSDRSQRNVIVPHNCSLWTTLFVEWVADYDTRTLTGKYMIDNDDKKGGSFSFNDIQDFEGVYVGARGSSTVHPFVGGISAIEVYKSKEKKHMPMEMKKLVVNDQLISNEDPPTKKKKFI